MRHSVAGERRLRWPDDLVADLCRECRLFHDVGPFVRPSLTPELTYWRLHGNGSHYAVYKDEELKQLGEWFPGSAEVYVMFNNFPRVKDAARFRELAESRGVAIR